MSSFSKYLVGIVNVPLSRLTFPPPNHEQFGPSGRQEDSKHVKRLVKIFEDTGCDPSDPDHQIFGLITPKVFKKVLASLRWTPGKLLQTVIAGDFPLIGGNYDVLCLEGRHRVQAARVFPGVGEDGWWAVKLHCIPEGKLRDAAIQQFSGKFSHEARYSDGEIYYNYRHFTRKNDDQSAREWKAMLTDCRAAALDHLCDQPAIASALDQTMLFPGLRAGLQLTNWDKNLATNCDELIIHYLRRRVYAVWWDTIVDHDPEVMVLVDPDSVRLVQFRAPSASEADRVFISTGMDSGLLLRKVSDARIREKIKRNLLSLDVVIPSIATFHENMKYIAIGADIIKLHLDVKPEKPGFAAKRTSTLYQRLRAHWAEPQPPVIEISEGQFHPLLSADWANPPPMIEIGKGVFQPLFGELLPWLAFTTIFIANLRLFVLLSTVQTLRDIRSEAPMRAYEDSGRLTQQFRRAQIVGFSNAKIQDGLQGPVTKPADVDFKSPMMAPISDWRGGKPFTRTFLALLEKSFLPALYRSNVPLNHPTPEFVQNDLISAFFGTFIFQLDFSRPVMSIAEEAVIEAGTELRDTLMEEGPRWEAAGAHKEGVTKKKASMRSKKQTKRATRGFSRHETPRRRFTRPKAGPRRTKLNNLPNSSARQPSLDARQPSILTGDDNNVENNLDPVYAASGLQVPERNYARPALQPPETATANPLNATAAAELNMPQALQTATASTPAELIPGIDSPQSRSMSPTSGSGLTFRETSPTLDNGTPLVTEESVLIVDSGITDPHIPNRDHPRSILQPLLNPLDAATALEPRALQPIETSVADIAEEAGTEEQTEPEDIRMEEEPLGEIGIALQPAVVQRRRVVQRERIKKTKAVRPETKARLRLDRQMDKNANSRPLPQLSDVSGSSTPKPDTSDLSPFTGAIENNLNPVQAASAPQIPGRSYARSALQLPETAPPHILGDPAHSAPRAVQTSAANLPVQPIRVTDSPHNHNTSPFSPIADNEIPLGAEGSPPIVDNEAANPQIPDRDRSRSALQPPPPDHLDPAATAGPTTPQPIQISTASIPVQPPRQGSPQQDDVPASSGDLLSVAGSDSIASSPITNNEPSDPQIPDRGTARSALLPPQPEPLPEIETITSTGSNALHPSQDWDAHLTDPILDTTRMASELYRDARGMKRPARVTEENESPLDRLIPYKRREIEVLPRRRRVFPNPARRDAAGRDARRREVARRQAEREEFMRQVAYQQAELEGSIPQQFVTIPLNSPEGPRARLLAGNGYRPRAPIFPN